MVGVRELGWPAALAFFFAVAAAAFGGLWGCSPRGNRKDPAIEPGRAPSRDVAPTTARDATVHAGDDTVLGQHDEGLLFVDDPVVLDALEARGASFAEMLGGPSVRGLDNGALMREPWYASLVEVIDADLAGVRRADPLAGVSVARHSHRLFDGRWLRSPAARFELVGLVNRLDRAAVIGGCGEVRLVYRLAYATTWDGAAIASRLPLTVSLELAVPHDRVDGCRRAARRWFVPAPHGGSASKEGPASPHDLADWIVSTEGPLSAAQRARTSLRRVALNLQSVRWPSTVRPDLGGHAEYVLRAFVEDSKGRLVPAALENTPDRARLSRGKQLFAELLSILRSPDRFAQIDGGTFALPDEFDAVKATSVTPRGWARQSNRPFSLVLRETDFEQVALSRGQFAASPTAFLRRLDDLSCPGCHQARSVAGFHFLGTDRAATSESNALAVSFSAHFARDLPRRRAILHALRDGEAPSYVRPLAERAAQRDSDYGAHCGLGDRGFAEWTCESGYRCTRFDTPAGDAAVGICLSDESGGVGDPCETGVVTGSADAHRDRVTKVERLPCRAGSVCNTNAVGFPGGMCTPECDARDDNVACGRIAILDAFNACLAKNQSFEDCIGKHSSPAGLRRCDVDHPCRDDYVCAKSGSSGACIPPYFIFQLRVDGHPVPPSR